MNKKIREIYIDNDFFVDTTLKIFNKETEKIAIIYGANGTGKTTIGRGVSNIKKENDFVNKSYFIDQQDSILQFSNEDLSNIHVFNEDFIEKDLKFKSSPENRLKSIVMFGKSVKNDEEISKLNDEIEKYTDEIKSLNIDDYHDYNNIRSPEYHLEELKKALRKDWALDEQLIRKIKNPPKINEELLNFIINVDFSSKFDSNDYETKKNKYLKLSDDIHPIEDTSLIELTRLKLPLDDINILLKKNFDRPVGNELIDRIAKTIADNTLERINEIKVSFKDGYCPYCFRDITEDEVKRIVNEINNIQNKEIEEYQEKLNTIRINTIEIDLTPFKIIDNKVCLELSNLINQLNNEIEKINKTIIEKINNPYDPIRMHNIDKQIIENLTKKANYLEKERIKINNDIKNRNKLKKELQDKNIIRAALNNKSLIENYKKQKQEKDEKLSKQKILNKEIKTKQREINKLRAETQNIGHALYKINEYLAMIFLDKDRLNLILEDEYYVVKSRGKNIPLNKLSNGERNAIVLCYFFTAINENCSEDEMFENKILVVLDDPLSSFDYNNKIGIYSFLRKMFAKILKNNESRIIVLTHQIETYFDIIGIVEDVGLKGKQISKLLLKNKTTVNFEKNHNIYKHIINDVYDVIIKNNDEINDDEMDGLGNKMRRILEAFSTFNYGVGISELSTDQVILESIKDKKLQDYFLNSMYKIGLNETSHLKNQTYAMIDIINLGFIDKEVLLRISRDVIAFIYLLNQTHIRKMLINKDINFIERHIDLIKEQIGITTPLS